MFKALKTIFAIAVAGFISSFPAADAGSGASGTFTGASNHITTGGVEVIKNGTYDTATGMGLMKSPNGTQSFTVPLGGAAIN